MTALAPRTWPSLSTTPADHGWYSWNIARGSAIWSESVYRLHGYEPGEVVATSALTFHHKHPEDLHECVDALQVGMLTKRLIVHEHRLVDAQRQVRPVVMIARAVTDDRGHTRNLRGFLLPVDGKLADEHTAHRGAAPLVPVLMKAFQVSEAAAQVMLDCRRKLTARRSRQQQDFAQQYRLSGAGGNVRLMLEDSMFPLDHLTLEPVDLAA
jgi:hypothetical protein